MELGKRETLANMISDQSNVQGAEQIDAEMYLEVTLDCQDRKNPWNNESTLW